MPIFRFKSVKNYTGQKKFTRTPSVASVTNIRYGTQYQEVPSTNEYHKYSVTLSTTSTQYHWVQPITIKYSKYPIPCAMAQHSPCQAACSCKAVRQPFDPGSESRTFRPQVFWTPHLLIFSLIRLSAPWNIFHKKSWLPHWYGFIWVHLYSSIEKDSSIENTEYRGC